MEMTLLGVLRVEETASYHPRMAQYDVETRREAGLKRQEALEAERRRAKKLLWSTRHAIEMSQRKIEQSRRIIAMSRSR